MSGEEPGGTCPEDGDVDAVESHGRLNSLAGQKP